MEDRNWPQIATYVAAAVVVLVAGVVVFGRGSAPPPAPVAIDQGQTPELETEREIAVVHVAGAVRRPGLYELPAGARVGEAVERADGMRGGADGTAINLAAEVADGQQILVPRRGPAGASPAAVSPDGGGTTATTAGTVTSPTSAAIGAKLSLATATAEQIDAAAEGIGPTLAARVIEFRDQSGGLGSLEQLREVPGIGEARFQALSAALDP